MHQVLAHGHQTLDGVEWRVCKNTDGTGQPLQRRLKLHDEGRNALGNAVEGVGSVAAAGVEDIVHETEHPSDVLPACSSNGLYLLGQIVQRIGQFEISMYRGDVEEGDCRANKCRSTFQLAKIDVKILAVQSGTWKPVVAAGVELEAHEVRQNGVCHIDGVDHRVLDELNCLAPFFHLRFVDRSLELVKWIPLAGKALIQEILRILFLLRAPGLALEQGLCLAFGPWRNRAILGHGLLVGTGTEVASLTLVVVLVQNRFQDVTCCVGISRMFPCHLDMLHVQAHMLFEGIDFGLLGGDLGLLQLDHGLHLRHLDHHELQVLGQIFERTGGIVCLLRIGNFAVFLHVMHQVLLPQFGHLLSVCRVV
mmetsp:Transcript_36882/g.88081  ORF Transcript_36882/g.88081 Transcript_36882/m.88081 type:complete len:365 (-) Transcript_36882:184-1278(-)